MRLFKNLLLSLLGFGCISLYVGAQLLPPAATGNKSTAASDVRSTRFVEGVDFKVLSSPQPTDTKAKIEVTEFFWYACPHCYDLEPEIQAWIKRQKNDVVLKRVPIAFREDFLSHSRIFYALEELDKEAEFASKVMKAIHIDRKQLLKEDEIFSWATSVGLDLAAFTKAYNSFTVQTKAKTANAQGSAYRVNGVPTLFVQGRYETSPSIAGTRSRSIETLDFLVEKARAEKK